MHQMKVRDASAPQFVASAFSSFSTYSDNKHPFISICWENAAAE